MQKNSFQNRPLYRLPISHCLWLCRVFEFVFQDIRSRLCSRKSSKSFKIKILFLIISLSKGTKKHIRRLPLQQVKYFQSCP